MKNWWNGLNKREQHLVLGMSALILVCAFFFALWQPLHDNLAKSQKELARKQQLLTWVQVNTAKFAGMNVQSGATNNTSLTNIVNNTARQLNITVSRMQPKDDVLQIWLDDVAFNDLLKWSETLYLQQGVVISAVDIAESNEPGRVRVNRLELSKG